MGRSDGIWSPVIGHTSMPPAMQDQARAPAASGGILGAIAAKTTRRKVAIAVIGVVVVAAVGAAVSTGTSSGSSPGTLKNGEGSGALDINESNSTAPSLYPTFSPTATPTNTPTEWQTYSPTTVYTAKPTGDGSSYTSQPTAYNFSTGKPTTGAPTTGAPTTAAPTTVAPSSKPLGWVPQPPTPNNQKTSEPTATPTKAPTVWTTTNEPTTSGPTAAPTTSPTPQNGQDTTSPTGAPTSTPTKAPTPCAKYDYVTDASSTCVGTTDASADVVVTVAECEELCSADASCVGVQFDSSAGASGEGTCSFFTAFGVPSSGGAASSFSCSTKSAPRDCTPTMLPTKTPTKSPNKTPTSTPTKAPTPCAKYDYVTDASSTCVGTTDASADVVVTVAECEELCSADASCVGVQFDSSAGANGEGTCSFFTAFGVPSSGGAASSYSCSTKSAPRDCTPTMLPTTAPTKTPTTEPTKSPSVTPTKSPTAGPTKSPSAGPTKSPTAGPTMLPTTAPTKMPTTSPTTTPTAAPTRAPTATPTLGPTAWTGEV